MYKPENGKHDIMKSFKTYSKDHAYQGKPQKGYCGPDMLEEK